MGEHGRAGRTGRMDGWTDGHTDRRTDRPRASPRRGPAAGRQPSSPSEPAGSGRPPQRGSSLPVLLCYYYFIYFFLSNLLRSQRGLARPGQLPLPSPGCRAMWPGRRRREPIGHLRYRFETIGAEFLTPLLPAAASPRLQARPKAAGDAPARPRKGPGPPRRSPAQPGGRDLAPPRESCRNSSLFMNFTYESYFA